MRRIDLAGQRFGRWQVLEYVGGNRWLCRCQCGEEKAVLSLKLRNGESKSCGCAKHTGSLKKHPLYSTWASIKTRTTNPNSTNYKSYGAKGVAMHPSWFSSFEQFLQDVGPKPSPEHTLDRYPNRNGNYEPGNVRWATPVEQANNKDGLRTVTINGKEVSLAMYARLNGVKYFSLRSKVDRGASPEEAVAHLLAYNNRPTICMEEGCSGALYARGMCSSHYQKAMRVRKEVRSDNTSGITGVSLHKKTGKWQLRLTINGRRISGGLFASLEEAAAEKQRLLERKDL